MPGHFKTSRKNKPLKAAGFKAKAENNSFKNQQNGLNLIFTLEIQY